MGQLDAIYARQSVEKADSISIQGQIDLCRRETGPEVQIYQDKGFSGKNTNRPAFQKLMEDVQGGGIRKIVVYRLDRFSRSVADFGRLWEVLQAHQVEFVSVHETFDTATPMGRAMLNIIMVFAQLERETTAQRVRDNYYQRVRLGAWPGGPPPYGFDLGRLQDSRGGTAPGLVANGQAPVVERIFLAYSMPEATLGSVARVLNGERIAGPRRPVWDNVTLSRLLHSPLYVRADQEVCLYYQAKGVVSDIPPEEYDGMHGLLLIGRRDRGAGKYRDGKDQHISQANHLGLIAPDLWLQCQYKLDTNRQLGRAGSGKHTWLSGLLKCMGCGYSIKVNREGERYYLLCSGRSNLKVCSQSIRVDLRTLEACVAEELERLLEECPLPEERGGPTGVELALEELERKINRLMDALAESSTLTMAYVNQAIGRLENQRARLLEQQCATQEENIQTGTKLRFGALSLEEKKMVAAQWIQEIRLGGEEVQVLWYL